MKSKFVIYGSLLGGAVGLFSSLLFPQLLEYFLSFVRTTNDTLGYPADYFSIKGGSFSDAILVCILVFGLVGGAIGLFVFRIKSFHKEKK